MANTTFQSLLDGVASYYGSGSDQWRQIAQYGVTAETLPIIQQIPGVKITVSNSGDFLGYDYSNPFAEPAGLASNINSNTQTGSYGAGSFGANINASATPDPSTGGTTMSSGARSVSTGSVLSTVADKVSLGVTGVALGTKLGKLIDSTLYSVNPDWWDEHYPTINPETWDTMATTEGGKNLIRSIFNLKNDEATMYLDERALAYTYQLLLKEGAYTSGREYTEVDADSPWLNGYPNQINCGSYGIAGCKNAYWSPSRDMYVEAYGEGSYVVMTSPPTADDVTVTLYSLNSQFQGRTRYGYGAPSGNWQTINARYTGRGTTLVSGTTFYTYLVRTLGPVRPVSNSAWGSNILPNTIPDQTIIATILFDGEYHKESELPGVSDNPDASTQVQPLQVINPTTQQPVTADDDLDDVLQALKNDYSVLFDDAIYEDVPQSDGSTKRITYIPVPYPTTDDNDNPTTDTTTGTDPQTHPEINPVTQPDKADKVADTVTTETTPPDTGNGNTPTTIVPTGTANALYSIYNPSQAELNAFGAWLWSTDFVDQLLKLFNDPMQAIIGLHKVFAQPPVSGASTIKVGYLNSNVSSNVVGGQYSTIDCGTVKIDEYFGNVLDYDPYTQIYIYLPFVGIQKLDTGDIMRASVNVVYHVDVLTGACLVELRVIRDGSGGTLYTYSGNCAVQYPISSGSYMGIIASLASVVGGVAGTIASGGAVAPIAMGAVSGVMNAHTRVEHSGNFSGNSGAMGIKKPYIIITRSQNCVASGFNGFVGYPANKVTKVSNCTGFIKCLECHVENVHATIEELREIETLLKTGIIV